MQSLIAQKEAFPETREILAPIREKTSCKQSCRADIDNETLDFVCLSEFLIDSIRRIAFLFLFQHDKITPIFRSYFNIKQRKTIIQ